MSVRDMVEAMIAGQRDPRRLADLARGRMTAKRAALIEALTGRFDDHHGELAAILLAQIDGLTGQIDALTTRIGELITDIPAAQGVDADGSTGPQAGRGPDAPVLPALDRLEEIPGISRHAAQVIIAEAGLDMTRFPTAAHLVSWARLCPRTLQSGARERPGRTAKGNPYLKGVLGDAAAAAGKTSTFLGERYRRLVKRRGKLKALVAIARTLLVIIWHLLADRAARYDDLGDNYYITTINTDRKVRSHIRQLEALGYTVTVAPAA
jgi:transposase